MLVNSMACTAPTEAVDRVEVAAPGSKYTEEVPKAFVHRLATDRGTTTAPQKKKHPWALAAQRTRQSAV